MEIHPEGSFVCFLRRFVLFCVIPYLTVMSFFPFRTVSSWDGLVYFPVQRVSYSESSDKNLVVSAG